MHGRQRDLPHPAGPVAEPAHRGAAARHHRRDCWSVTRFPLDGEYEFQAKLYRTNLNIMRGLEFAHQVEFTVDGERDSSRDHRRQRPISRRCSTSRPTRATPWMRGCACACRSRPDPHDVTAAFVEDLPVAGPDRLQPFLRSSTDNFDWAGRPHIQTLHDHRPVQRHRSRRHAQPAPDFRRAGPTSRRDEHGLRRKILAPLARRAYRQPVSDADLQRILSFYEAGRREGSFEAGIELALAADSRQPEVRLPRRARSRRARRPARSTESAISSWRRGCRSSCGAAFRTTSCSTLAAARASCTIRRCSTQQVRRMLRRPEVARAGRATSPASGCSCATCATCCRTRTSFPDFDDNLRQAFQRETELFFESIMREDRSVLDLLTADYTFVNERLARHYGIAECLRQPVPPRDADRRARRGLLGKAASWR